MRVYTFDRFLITFSLSWESGILGLNTTVGCTATTIPLEVRNFVIVNAIKAALKTSSIQERNELLWFGQK